MKIQIKKLTLGAAAAALALPAFCAAPAQAGDYDGGLKGMRGTYVPVPAPVPIPEYEPKWYFRADTGLAFNAGVGMSEDGMRYGANDFGYHSGRSFGSGGFGVDKGKKNGWMAGFGAGYYATDNWRFDITGEWRSEKNSTMEGSFRYNAIDSYGQPTDTDVLGRVRDKLTVNSTIFMANAYYDFGNWRGLKPYVGGGIGFSVNRITRHNATQISACDNVNDPTCSYPHAVGSYGGREERDYAYSLAANLQAGVSYRLSDITSLDLNYRYLYVKGSSVNLSLNGTQSRAELDDSNEHYLRAGLRFDIR